MKIKIEKKIDELIENKIIERREKNDYILDKLMDSNSKVVKNIEKKYSEKIKTNILSVNGKYLARDILKGRRFIALPECVSISRYGDYLDKLYNICEGIDAVCMSYDENVIIDIVETIQTIDFEPISVQVSSCSLEGISVDIKIKDNLLTEHLTKAISKIGFNNLNRVFTDINISDIKVDNTFIVERRDVKINKFNTAIY